MTAKDGRRTTQRYWLYCVSAECPVCQHVTQFVEETESPVALDMDVGVSKSHCPECGIHLPSIGEAWFINAEHEIEVVEPTQEREND